MQRRLQVLTTDGQFSVHVGDAVKIFVQVCVAFVIQIFIAQTFYLIIDVVGLHFQIALVKGDSSYRQVYTKTVSHAAVEAFQYNFSK